MTRKRFVKRLMGEGASRNKANQWANKRLQFQSYSSLYPRASFSLAIARLGMTSKQAGKALGELAEELRKMMISSGVITAAAFGVLPASKSEAE